jgi:hypothetical protein
MNRQRGGHDCLRGAARRDTEAIGPMVEAVERISRLETLGRAAYALARPEPVLEIAVAITPRPA